MARPAGSKCNDLVGIDRVALMFLSLERLPQDAVWALWLEQASGLVPVQPLQVTSQDFSSDAVIRSKELPPPCDCGDRAGVLAAVACEDAGKKHASDDRLGRPLKALDKSRPPAMPAWSEM